MIHDGEFITVVGGNHCKGSEVFKIGQMIRLVKDFENPYDDEAITVEMDSIGAIGYVANSTNTVARGTKSAGRIYETFEYERYGIIRFILKGDAIVQLLNYHEYSLQKGDIKITTCFFDY